MTKHVILLYCLTLNVTLKKKGHNQMKQSDWLEVTVID